MEMENNQNLLKTKKSLVLIYEQPSTTVSPSPTIHEKKG
jgi:hypothetical protein